MIREGIPRGIGKRSRTRGCEKAHLFSSLVRRESGEKPMGSGYQNPSNKAGFPSRAEPPPFPD